jgi:DNA-binding transcriptional MerR regulator
LAAQVKNSMTVILHNTVMEVANYYQLTVDELSNEVVRLLKVNRMYATHPDNRVSSAPDTRTIRYYSSLGLIDRPTIEGRIAKYQRRHVLQLLALKTLQSRSLPLSEIQERLYGRSDHELESLISSCIDEEKEATAQLHKEPMRTVLWREIVIEPGLKILADDSWNGITDQSLLEKKILDALDTFKALAHRATGENK